VSLFVLPVTIDVRKILGKNENNIYLMGNENGAAKIYIFDLSANQLFLRQSDSFIIYDATEINEYYLILATSSGLVEYDYNSNNTVPLISSSSAEIINYDDVENQVYAGEGKTVFVYGYQLHNLLPLNNYQIADSVRSINFLYNRENFK
jgi:hypothetical protein